jgi:hypothetical protein
MMRGTATSYRNIRKNDILTYKTGDGWKEGRFVQRMGKVGSTKGKGKVGKYEFFWKVKDMESGAIEEIDSEKCLQMFKKTEVEVEPLELEEDGGPDVTRNPGEDGDPDLGPGQGGDHAVPQHRAGLPRTLYLGRYQGPPLWPVVGTSILGWVSPWPGRRLNRRTRRLNLWTRKLNLWTLRLTQGTMKNISRRKRE